MSNQSQSVLDLVEFCGGQSNLRRVLKAEEQQFIEVVDAGLLTSHTESWVKLDVLGETQIVLPNERQLTDSELLELGTLIDENLRRLPMLAFSRLNVSSAQVGMWLRHKVFLTIQTGLSTTTASTTSSISGIHMHVCIKTSTGHT
ncbi:hypothetical protein JCM19232_4601 [Vibrio ishigakensis]|uniref:Uncharacterized protein n=1 Tax=Vibrio ishigakensis TaxID=1481914 RepID=A0A0B8PJM3_9VIBR|nr:hypothetical protein JCM19232_4601 [Vibrio ishigakensis]